MGIYRTFASQRNFAVSAALRVVFCLLAYPIGPKVHVERLSLLGHLSIPLMGATSIFVRMNRPSLVSTTWQTPQMARWSMRSRCGLQKRVYLGAETSSSVPDKDEGRSLQTKCRSSMKPAR